MKYVLWEKGSSIQQSLWQDRRCILQHQFAGCVLSVHWLRHFTLYVHQHSSAVCNLPAVGRGDTSSLVVNKSLFHFSVCFTWKQNKPDPGNTCCPVITLSSIWTWTFQVQNLEKMRIWDWREVYHKTILREYKDHVCPQINKLVSR